MWSSLWCGLYSSPWHRQVWTDTENPCSLALNLEKAPDLSRQKAWQSVCGSPGAYIAGTARKDCQDLTNRACLLHCGPFWGRGEAMRKLVGGDLAGTPGIPRTDTRPSLETMVGQGSQAWFLSSLGEQILPCFAKRKGVAIRIVSLCPLTE